VGNGANANVADLYGRKPLHYAAMYGRDEAVLYLLSLGLPLESADVDGFTPLTYSIVGGHTKCVELFLSHGANVEPESEFIHNPLSLASEHGHYDIATLLLSKGSRITPNSDGLTPLHLATREGHANLCQLLISHGADVNGCDSLNGWTPIFYAASEGHLECVKALLKAGADLAIKDETGWLPWTYALYRGHISVAALLEVEGSQLVSQPAKSVEETAKKPPNAFQPMAPSGLFEEEKDIDMEELEDLPSLSLPPPIIPFRIYGHNYLDKKYCIQLGLGNKSTSVTSPIKLFRSQQLSSLKLVISNKPDIGIPYNIILPSKDDQETYTFLADDLSEFSIVFDIFPTFGTKVLGRAVLLSSQISSFLKSSGSNNEKGDF
ncbi:phosphate system positive regulatory protein pho81, partial [Chytridiales sp. JEL 0842]